MDIEKLEYLRDRLAKATGPDQKLDADIWLAVGAIPYKWKDEDEAFYLSTWSLGGEPIPLREDRITANLNAVTAFCERVLPGWWWKVGTCCVSDDACIAPDYNSPIHGERLKSEFPLPAERYFDADLGRETWGPFDEGFDIDRRPPGNVPLALLEALLSALIEIEKAKESRK